MSNVNLVTSRLPVVKDDFLSNSLPRAVCVDIFSLTRLLVLKIVCLVLLVAATALYQASTLNLALMSLESSCNSSLSGLYLESGFNVTGEAFGYENCLPCASGSCNSSLSGLYLESGFNVTGEAFGFENCLPCASSSCNSSLSGLYLESGFNVTGEKPENLSHEELVRRASSLVTDSANTYLSQTTLALLDSLTSYVKVIDRRKDCKRFESCWMMALKLSEMAGEAAFNAGADQATVTAQNSRQLAQSQVEQVRQLIPETERQLKDSKAEHSVRLQNALSTAMEDEDIPDAYLRED
ncbi:diablo mitochondrial-like protein [Labeo rohita]|uniref:Diablo mitochondrial-like protein n=1 Tax=Labeo rohita TaxID=84645 RepID=A0A498N464_LABRO|nr:diablo mitochondrial-like protein [Labeo rohita]